MERFKTVIPRSQWSRLTVAWRPSLSSAKLISCLTNIFKCRRLIPWFVVWPNIKGTNLVDGCWNFRVLFWVQRELSYSLHVFKLLVYWSIFIFIFNHARCFFFWLTNARCFRTLFFTSLYLLLWNRNCQACNCILPICHYSSHMQLLFFFHFIHLFLLSTLVFLLSHMGI